MSLIARALRHAPPPGEPRRAESQRADALMSTLGYESVPGGRSVPGPVTKASVVLLCVLAVVAGFWLGKPESPVVAPDDAMTAAVPPPERQQPVTDDAATVAPPIPRTSMLGDVELPSDPLDLAPSTPDVEPGSAVAESSTLVELTDGPDRVDTTSLQLPDDGPGLEARPLLAPSPVTARGETPGPVVTLTDEELRALVELDISAVRRRASQMRPSPDTGGPSPVIVARSSRPSASPTAPPEPPPPAMRGARNAVPVRDGFRIALRHHESGDFDAARRRYQDLIASDAADAEARNNLGVLYQEEGRTDEAIREFEQALAIDPTYVKAHNNLGVAFLAVGRLEEAGREFEKALVRDPGNLESKVNLGLVLHATGQSGAAIERLLEVIDANPGHIEAHYNLALVYEADGDATRALEEYRQFLALATGRHAELAAGVRRRVELLASSRIEP